MNEKITISRIELIHLKKPYAQTRVAKPRQLIKLSESFARNGQLVPIMVVPGDAPHMILIDGYLRAAAAAHCGMDTLLAEVWCCGEKEALLQIMAKSEAAPKDIFEQASLLQELINTHGVSRQELSIQLGKHPSWISRRLSLLEGLPKTAIKAVCQGKISSWAASRVIVPLARANSAHAEALTRAICRHPVSTRQLSAFFQHYQRSNRGTRLRMIEDPPLFFQSLTVKEAEEEAQRLRDGPEGRWRKDAQAAMHILRRLCKTASEVFHESQDQLKKRVLLTAYNDTQSAFYELSNIMERIQDDQRTGTECGNRSFQDGNEHSSDCQEDENGPQDREENTGRQTRPDGPTSRQIRRSFGSDHPGVLCRREKCGVVATTA